MNEQLYKDMAWEMASELGELLVKPITENTLYAVEGCIEGVGVHYHIYHGVLFGGSILSLVYISCDAQKNEVDIKWMAPQKACERNILDKEESEEYSTFLRVNKFKTKEDV